VVLSASLELIVNFPGMLSVNGDGIIFPEFDDLTLGCLPHPQDINDFLRLLIAPDHDSPACPKKRNSKQEKWDTHKSRDNPKDKPVPQQGENEPEHPKEEGRNGQIYLSEIGRGAGGGVGSFSSGVEAELASATACKGPPQFLQLD
jgi:hypothetical protein